jgi:hypothetical protein
VQTPDNDENAYKEVIQMTAEQRAKQVMKELQGKSAKKTEVKENK